MLGLRARRWPPATRVASDAGRNYPEKLTCHLHEAILCAACGHWLTEGSCCGPPSLLHFLLLLLLLLGREASPLSTTSACSLAAPHGPREEGLSPRGFLF